MGVTNESERHSNGELPPPLTDTSGTDTDDTGYDKITHTLELWIEGKSNHKAEVDEVIQAAIEALVVQDLPKNNMKPPSQRFQEGCIGCMSDQKLKYQK